MHYSFTRILPGVSRLDLACGATGSGSGSGSGPQTPRALFVPRLCLHWGQAPSSYPLATATFSPPPTASAQLWPGCSFQPVGTCARARQLGAAATLLVLSPPSPPLPSPGPPALVQRQQQLRHRPRRKQQQHKCSRQLSDTGPTPAPPLMPRGSRAACCRLLPGFSRPPFELNCVTLRPATFSSQQKIKR